MQGCLLYTAVHLVQMVKALVAFCTLRSFLFRQCGMEIHSQLCCIDHDIFGASGMHIFSMEFYDSIGCIEILILDLTLFGTVHRIAIHSPQLIQL